MDRWEILHDPDSDADRAYVLLRGGEEVARFADAGSAGQRIMEELGGVGDGDEFFGVLTVEGVNVGNPDNRYLEPGQGEFRNAPLSLFAQTQIPESGGHATAFLAGRIDEMTRMADGRRIFMRGFFDTNADGQEASRLCERQVLRFVSADLAPPMEFTKQVIAVDDDGFPSQTLTRYGPYTVGGATMVAHPAIPQAVIWKAGMDVPTEVTSPLPDPISADFVPDGYDPDAPSSLLDEIFLLASASGSTSLPLSDQDRPWDAGAATGRVSRWASSDNSGDPDKIAWSKYGKAFFHKEGDGTKKGDYSLPFADVINGTLTAVWKGVTAAAGAAQGARQSGSGARFSDAKSRIASYYAKAKSQYKDPKITPPWEKATDPEGLDAPTEQFSMIAAGTLRPPRAWFENPELVEGTRPVVTDDGRVYGHLLPWDQRHTGFTDRRIYAPHSRRGYSYFLTGAVQCDDGTEVPTGRVTMGGTHAKTNLDADHALAHYDDVSMAIADVAVGEDAYGVWIAGAVRPGTTEEQLYDLRASSLSGDWRLLDGGLELIIAHAVNAPGFPVAQVASAAGECGECPETVTALVAGFAQRPNNVGRHAYAPGGPPGGQNCLVCGAPASAHAADGGGTAAADVAALRREVATLRQAVGPLLELAADRVVAGIPNVARTRLSALRRDVRALVAATTGNGDGDSPSAEDLAGLAQAVDAAVDQAADLLTAAGETIDELIDALGGDDADEPDGSQTTQTRDLTALEAFMLADGRRPLVATPANGAGTPG